MLYVVVNKTRQNSGNRRCYVSYGGGMNPDLFWWSYKKHALIFTEDNIKIEELHQFLQGIDYEIITITDSESKEYGYYFQ